MSQFQKLSFNSDPASEARELAKLEEEKKKKIIIRWVVIGVMIIILGVLAHWVYVNMPKL